MMYPPSYRPAVRTARLALATASTLLSACHGATSPATPVITSLSIVSGNEQSAPVGTILPQPVVLRVTDQHKDPMPGVGVTINVPFGDGSIGTDTPTVLATDANGEISISWTLGTAVKPDTLVATVPEAVNGAGTSTAAGVTVEEKAVAGPAGP